MDKIKDHIKKKNRRKALKKKFFNIIAVSVIAIALIYVFIFLAFGIV